MRALLLATLLASGCVRTAESNRPLRSLDFSIPRDSSPADLSPPLDLFRPDAALQTQLLKILATEDDGEITGGQLLLSGETWFGNLIHTGSWASVSSGGPTMTYAFLRYRLTRALPAGAQIASVELKVFGHALTGGSQWSPTLHKLIVSADLSASASPVSSELGFPGGAKGAAQTKTVLDWGQIVWKPDAWNTSPNLAAIVQELVDTQGGLAAGAYLQLWLRAPKIYPEDAELPFEDLDHANGQAAALTLKWVE